MRTGVSPPSPTHLVLVSTRRDVLGRAELAPVPPRLLLAWECSHGAIVPARATKQGADATRGIDEALQPISEPELRRRFRVDPAEGLRSTSRRRVSTSTGAWPSSLHDLSPRSPPRKSPFPER
jgi:hypothetical protein